MDEQRIDEPSDAVQASAAADAVPGTEDGGLSPGPASAQPAVTWQPPGPPPPGLTFGGILSDAFARYAADPIRIFAVFLGPSILSIVVARQQSPTILVGLLSLLASSIVFVVADRGPAVRLGYAASVGVQRFGWLILTSFVIGALVFGITLIVGLVGAIVLGASKATILLVLIVIVVLALAWFASRLALALPAVVVDGLRANPAFERGRAATKKVSNAASVFFALVVVVLASVPAGLATGALDVVSGAPAPLVWVLGGVLTGIVAPLGTLTLLSAYRRAYPAVVRVEDAEAGEAGSAEATPVPVPTVQAPPVPAPPFDTRARGAVAVVAGVAVVGLVAFTLTIGAIVAGVLGPSPGTPRGTIAFGTAADLSTCTVTGAFTTTAPNGTLAWVGAFSKRTTTTDEISLKVIVDGTEVLNQVQTPGTYDCLGTTQPETGFQPGTYELRLLVNDEVSARGSFTVR